MQKPCIYLSGPMSGLPNHNFGAFNAAAMMLRTAGYPVVNPADFGSNPETSWASCLKRDLTALFHCDRVVTLAGWEQSKGSQLEVHVAKELGIPVVTYKQMMREVMGETQEKS